MAGKLCMKDLEKQASFSVLHYSSGKRIFLALILVRSWQLSIRYFQVHMTFSFLADSEIVMLALFCTTKHVLLFFLENLVLLGCAHLKQ